MVCSTSKTLRTFPGERVSRRCRSWATGRSNLPGGSLGEIRAGCLVLQSSILGLEAVDELDELLPRFAVQEDADEIRSPPDPQAVELEQAARHGGFGTELAERDLGFQSELVDRWHLARVPTEVTINSRLYHQLKGNLPATSGMSTRMNWA
jgi:hypothetical protein